MELGSEAGQADSIMPTTALHCLLPRECLVTAPRHFHPALAVQSRPGSST